MEWMIIAFTFSIMAFLFAAHALIEVKAMQKSTHTVQYVDPLSKESPQAITEEIKKLMGQPDLENIV